MNEALLCRLRAIAAAGLLGAAVAGASAEAAGCRFGAVPGDRNGVWTPHQRDDENARLLHERYVAEAARGEGEIVFLGDSITQGWSKAAQIWNERYAALHALDFGVSGDHVQDLAWRIEHGTLAGLAPRVLVLMIGTNNLPLREPAQLGAAIAALLDLLHCAQPKAKLLLLGILPRGGGAADAEQARLDARRKDNIAAVNAALARLADGQQIVFLDMGAAFRSDDGGLKAELSPDRLHLNVEGYRVWAETMAPALDAMLRR